MIQASNAFMPHGQCFLWQPDVLWLNVGSDFFYHGRLLHYFERPLLFSL